MQKHQVLLILQWTLSAELYVPVVGDIVEYFAYLKQLHRVQVREPLVDALSGHEKALGKDTYLPSFEGLDLQELSVELYLAQSFNLFQVTLVLLVRVEMGLFPLLYHHPQPRNCSLHLCLHLLPRIVPVERALDITVAPVFWNRASEL